MPVSGYKRHAVGLLGHAATVTLCLTLAGCLQAHRIDVQQGNIVDRSAFADLRLPELFGGYERHPARPPSPYADTCSPQAWAAAALVYRSLKARA